MPQIKGKSQKGDSRNADLKLKVTKEGLNKEAVDKEHFKAVAKQKFNAVLKHEINSRRNNTETNPRASEGSSQFFRIENSQIFSINDMPNKAEISKDTTKFNPKLNFNNIESSRNNQKANKDDTHVFIYDPLLISSDSLNYISAEKHKVSSSSVKQTTFSNDDFMEIGPDPYSETIFRCYLCPYFHVKEMMIARHWIQTHLSHNVYACPYCQSSFLTNYLTAKHIVEAHEGEPIQIDIKRSNQFAVKLAFEQKNALFLKSEKVATDNKDKPVVNVNVKCHKCNLECKSITDLEEHHKHVHIHFRPYSCGMCNSRVCFATRIDLDHHVKITHPFLVKDAANAQDQEFKRVEAEVSIDWSQTCHVSEKGKLLKCNWCDFKTTDSKEICQHAFKVHQWSKSINCPTCNMVYEMKCDHNRLGKILCTSCSTLIKITHNMDAANSLVSTSLLYRCTPCKYKTHSKGSMCRHLKYSHSNYRPFGCSYCSHTAVERPKIRSHILSTHPDKEVKVIEEIGCQDSFKKDFEELFKKFVTTEVVELFRNAFSGELKLAGSNPLLNQKTSFECGTCKFRSDYPSFIEKHIQSYHKDDEVQPEIKTLNSMNPVGEHFKCISCNYRCYDRSCMARHVKYKHLTSRPHQCPHCNYQNVEKTKVRLHVGSNHPNFEKGVKTNHHLLEQMSLEAKKFYIRVGVNGKEYSDNGNIMSDVAQQHNIHNQIPTALQDEKNVVDEGQNKDLVAAGTIEGTSAKSNSSKEDDEDMDSLSDVAHSFAESIDDEDMIDLNENNLVSSDEDDMMSVEQETGSNKVTEICINNLIVDEAVLKDPKITLQVPKVYLQDYVNIREDLETLFKKD